MGRLPRAARIPVNRGSVIVMTFTWPVGENLALDLTGWTLDFSEISAALVGHASIVATDAAAGKVRIRIDALPDMPPASFTWLRPRAIPPTGPADALTLPRL